MTQLTGILKAQRKEYASGDVIGGKYGLVRLLGEGGMGSVWVAENMSLKANVALKLIRADVAESSANERFLSEARLAARLQHAAIVRVFDFGKTEQDEPFIVMELLEGETLGQRLGRLGAIDPMELCQILLPIIDALHSAHGHGVIHRDLKPDNVFVAKTDGGGVQPKLLDFGIAKLRGESAFHTTKLTQAGTLIGSPDYMSPEQARGETDLDPRSDVWALCVLAYECLVGKPPFHGDNYNALLWAIIHDEPVPITVFQAGDAELWRILKTGFAKDRNVRWESARKLGEALAAWLESHGVVEDVCNRSLNASWLPAERPTRPELAPFDPHAPGLPQRRPSNGSLAPTPTLSALRRPHAMSLWFAGLGLLTLLGAMLLSRTETDGIPTVDAEGPGGQSVGTLLPGPAPETRDPVVTGAPPGSALGSPLSGEAALSGEARPGSIPSGGAPPAGTWAGAGVRAPSRDSALGERQRPLAQEPIAAPAADDEPSNEPSSWKSNHGRGSLEREGSLAEAVRNGMDGTGNSGNRPGNSSGNSARGSGDTASERPRPAAKSGPSKPAAEASAKPKPARAAAKKAPEKSAAETEVDFGI
jgi:serine/threonine protein kinase